MFATLYSKLGATAGTKDVLGMMQEKMEEVVTTSFKGATSTAIKEEIEKAVNDALKEQVTLAIVQGVMGSAATGFQANINTLLNTSNPNVTAWRDDAVNRLAEVRQVALIHTRSEGAMNTISSTSDAVGNAADLLSMSLSATGIGAAPGVFVKAVSSALSTLKSTAQTVNGLNYGLTLSKMAAWGGANPSSSSIPSSSSFLRYAYRAMPLQASFALPENFHPGTVLAQSNTAMSLLGQQAAAGLLSEFLSGVGNFSATLEESAFPLSQVSEYVFDQAASGNITADQGVLLIDTFLDLSLNQLSNAGYLMDALVRWDDVDSRYGVMAQAYESAAILTDNTETLNGISTTIVPAVFSPAISAITYPQTPLVFGSQFTIQVTVDNSSDVAGSTLLTLGTYDTSPERLADVTRSLRVISNLVVNPEDLPTDSNGDGRVGLAEAVNYLGQIEKYTLKETIETVDLAAQGSVNITFGPFAVERLQQEFLIGVNGRSIRVLGVQGYQDGIPPVLMSRFPTPDEILPDPPGFITVFIENGTGSGEIQSGQLFLGGQKVGDVTTGGIHTFAVSSLISSGGEYDVSLVLQTAAGEHPENWSFTVVGN